MQVDYEVAHVGIVHGSLGHRFPCLIGFSVVRVHTDHIDLVEAGELQIGERFELSTKHQVKQLLGPTAGVGGTSWSGSPRRSASRGSQMIAIPTNRLPFRLSGSEVICGNSGYKGRARRLLRS